jgi:hypothetical protein
VRHRPREQHDQPLQHEHHVAAEAVDLEGQLAAALVQRAEQQRRQHDAAGVVAADQADGDAGKTRAGHEVGQQAAVHTGELVHAHQAAQGAGRGHAQHHQLARLDAGVHRGPGREAHGAQRVAAAAPPEHQPRQPRSNGGDEHRQIERRARPLDAQGAQQLVHAGHPRAGVEGAAFGRHVAGLLQRAHQQVGQQRRGDEVEHDGRDDRVAAAPGLQCAGHRAPHAAEGGSRQHHQRQHQHGRQVGAQAQRRQARAQAAHDGLPLAADVEQAAMEGDGHRQPREHEGGGVVQRVADAGRRAEGALGQQREHLGGVEAHEQRHAAGHQQRDGQVDGGQQGHVHPARQFDGLAHARSRSSVWIRSG